MLLKLLRRFGIDGKFIRFGIVGIVNTVFGTALMFALYNIFNCSYYVSSFCNYFFGSILSFFLNKYFTFDYKKKSPATIIRFIINIGVCYVLAYYTARPLIRLALKGLSDKFTDNIAMLSGMCIFVILNYYGQRFFVFNEDK